MEDPARTRNETTDQPRSAMRRRSVQYFKRADAWFNRFVRLAAVAHEGFWLGCLSADDLNAITAEHYDHSHESASQEHNLRGFLDWELAVVNRHFLPGARILVAAAGEKFWLYAAPATRRTDSSVIRPSFRRAMPYSSNSENPAA
jgi:hypothetical protein